MSDLEMLTQAVHRMVAMDFEGGAVRVDDPSLAPLATAITGLSHTLQRETVAAEHVEALFLATPTVLIQLNLSGEVTAVNPAGQALLGAGVEGLSLSVLLAELQADADAPAPSLSALSETARVVVLDFSGAERHLDLTLAPLQGRQGQLQGYVVSAVDVTADVRALRSMDAARQAALASAEARTGFLAAISHEIRTPLNGIIGTLSLMRSRGEVGEELAVLHRCADQLMGLVGGVLDFTRIDAGKLQLTAEPVDLAALVSDVASVLGPRLRPGVTVAVDTDGLQACAVTGDPVRLRQILLNLGGNAARFTEAGRVVLRVSSEASAVVFSVEDTGQGIPSDALDRIFEPYEQVGTPHSGTGLGLPITRGLVEAMGGTIAVSSTQGEGSTFTVSLRLAPVPVAPPAAPVLAAPAAGLRVLVVDDNAINRLVVRGMLERLSCTVEEADNGQRAVDRVCRAGGAGLDLVLMDCQMPVLGGVAATGQIRAAGLSSLPIVALTASALAEERARCLAAGMDAFLTKPLRLEALQIVVARYRREQR